MKLPLDDSIKDILKDKLNEMSKYLDGDIFNYFGQLVLQSKTTTINVSDLSSGIYFLEVETNKGKGVKKIIKE